VHETSEFSGPLVAAIAGLPSAKQAIAANRRTTGEIEAEYPFLEVMARAD